MDIVGRQDELAFLHRFIDEPPPGPGVVVLEGEPGIGKSTLWLAGVEHARSTAVCVLSSRPAEAERSLSHAALCDLFDPILDEVLPALSIPRQRALKVAMLRDDARSAPVDHLGVAVAVRDVLQLLAAERTVMVAIDDIQWLDQPSAAALAFALRRLTASRLLLLLTRRTADPAQPSELEAALPPDSTRRMRVQPLSVGALHQLLRDQLGRTFPRQTLLRVHEQSGGNPFFALEVARALGAEIDPAQPLPVPKTLEELLHARMAGLPTPTRDALSLVSVLGTTSDFVLDKAGVAPAALDPAFAAQVIEREHGTIRFTHPLLASVLYRNLGGGRRAMHARIAEIEQDPVRRVRHIALAATSPNAGVASKVEGGARLAMDRGDAATAGELYERAARLTPPQAGDERHRRTLAAARAHQAAGEWTRSRALCSEVLAQTPSGVRRAEALILLAELEGVDRAAELLEEALAAAASHPSVQSAILCRLAWATRFRTSDDYAKAAFEIADRLDDDLLRIRSRSVEVILGWFHGDAPAPDDLPLLVRHFPEAVGGERLVQEATQAIVNTLAPAARRQGALELLESEDREWRDRDEPRSARARWGLAWVEFWAGHWAVAAEHAAAAHGIAIQYGLEVPQDHLPVAVIAVHRGELELARQHSQRALGLAVEQFGAHPPQHLGVLALVALWEGDHRGALEWFRQADERATALGWGEPSVRWWTADHVELLLELGRPGDAEALLSAWETDAERVGREWVLAHAARCRGLVDAAAGKVDRALSSLAKSRSQHEAVGDPFGRARSLLALGITRRRARQKRPARDDIQAAVEGFEAIGARRWAARARTELARIGGRIQEQGLTAAERRVA